ncbi:hypothetical protein [Patiriisocius marinus]|uniref:hypothetical protein n=1 Tax=Patiriisocius marinus TaxID=1397112 RepID=UPI00232C659E|nr:hypothetical protein [Patiriisocius marinus]
MKILVFENEFVYLETAFNYVNEFYFNSKIEFFVHSSSQDFGDFLQVVNYDGIIVDISLSKKSVLDGYGILKKLKSLNFAEEKIIIMTGNHKIKSALKEQRLSESYNLITKPINLLHLKLSLAKLSNN